MKIALAQMTVIPGALDKNLTSMLELISEAKSLQVDLIAFPEMAVSGYLLSDLWLDRSFCEELMLYNQKVITASDSIAVAFGSAFNDVGIGARSGSDAFHPNKDGRSRLYNAVLVAQYGQLVKRPTDSGLLPVGVQPKTLLPNYRFFDDQRYFFSLLDVAIDFGVTVEALAQPFQIEGKQNSVKIGFEVCEDLWCADYRRDVKPLNVTRALAENGAEVIINVSASPWTWRKHDARDRRILFLKQELQDKFVPFFYVNNVGAQNNGKNIITFDGGTTVYNREGEPCLASENFFTSDLLIADHSQLPETAYIRSEYPKVEQKFRAIRQGLQYIKGMLGWQDHPGFIVGLSGGIDSAVVTALLVAALGKDKVSAVNMPSAYNSEATRNVARKIADNLQIDFFEVPIESLVEAHQGVFNELDQRLDSPHRIRSLSDENIQAKIRGTSILSNMAGRYGRMFTNNGNKVEIALGYATLYGDIGGVIAPIGDLTKQEVYDLARFLNQSLFARKVIPDELFPDELFVFRQQAIAPSAELRDEQIDPMKFGYHCALLEAFTSFAKVCAEDVLEWYLNGELEEKLGIGSELIKRWGIDDPRTFVEDLEWFSESIRKSIFKRIQAPPIIVTSPSAYGFDIRESQLPAHENQRYRQLKARILALGHYTKPH